MPLVVMERFILVGMVQVFLPSGYDIHSLPWKDPPFCKPSISIRAIYTMAMLNSQRVVYVYSL